MSYVADSSEMEEPSRSKEVSTWLDVLFVIKALISETM